MVEYKCIRCGYTAKQRCNFRNHLNRKNICKPLLDNISIDEMRFLYGFESIEKNPQNTSILPQKPSFQTPQKPSILPQKTSILPQKPSKNLKNEKVQKCSYCFKEFSRLDNFKRHMKTCKKKQECEQLALESKDNELKEMEKKIKMLEENIQTKIINNTNNTINNTININNYGDENIKHLRTKDFTQLLSSIYNAVPKLIEKIHFDPDHPENQNIKYTNKKLPYLKVLKDDKWQLVSKKNELLDLIDNKYFMLKDKYYSILEKNKYNITEVQRHKIDEFMDKYNYEDKKMMIDLIERTELMLLNNS